MSERAALFTLVRSSPRRACERMDRIREEIRKSNGVLNIGVPAIRELRGELPEP